jgi:hypothetical protein
MKRSLAGMGIAAALACASAPPASSGAPSAAPSSVIVRSNQPHDTSSGDDLDAHRPPEYWAARIAEPEVFEARLERLERFVLPLEVESTPDARVVVPLARSYVEHGRELTGKQRARLMALLTAMNDARIEPAVCQTISDFVAGQADRDSAAGMRHALLAVRRLHLVGCRPALLQTFLQLHVSSLAGGRVYKDLYEAMVELADVGWVPELSRKLSEPMHRPSDASPSGFDAFRDQQFWQTVSAELLGLSGQAAAVEPLVTVLLDPEKIDVHVTALLGLVKLGDPAFARASSLIGEPGRAHLGALVLGTQGRRRAEPVLLEALKRAKTVEERAAIALQLSHVPASTAGIAAFKQVVATTPIDNLLAAQLVEAAATFRDSALVPWLLERADKQRGAPDDVAAQQAVYVTAALKLAKVAQWPQVSSAAAKYGGSLEQAAASHAKKLLDHCSEDVACYVRALREPDNLTMSNQFAGIKAACMAAVLGSEATVPLLIDELKVVANAAVRFTIAQSIDHLLPDGSPSAAQRLDELIRADARSPDRERAAGNAPLKQVLYRLRARSP